MKNLKRLLIIAVIALSVNSVTAQNNIGHANIADIIQSMPEAKKKSLDYQILQKTYQDEFQNAEVELRKKLERYAQEQPNQTMAVNQQRQEEVEKEQADLQTKFAAAQQHLQQEEKGVYDEMQKLQVQVQQAADAVAKEMNLIYVLDASAIVSSNGGTDITDKIKAKLGIQ